jgi:hypothetical protein
MKGRPKSLRRGSEGLASMQESQWFNAQDRVSQGWERDIWHGVIKHDYKIPKNRTITRSQSNMSQTLIYFITSMLVDKHSSEMCHLLLSTGSMRAHSRCAYKLDTGYRYTE